MYKNGNVCLWRSIFDQWNRCPKNSRLTKTKTKTSKTFVCQQYTSKLKFLSFFAGACPFGNIYVSLVHAACLWLGSLWLHVKTFLHKLVTPLIRDGLEADTHKRIRGICNFFASLRAFSSFKATRKATNYISHALILRDVRWSLGVIPTIYGQKRIPACFTIATVHKSQLCKYVHLHTVVRTAGHLV